MSILEIFRTGDCSRTLTLKYFAIMFFSRIVWHCSFFCVIYSSVLTDSSARDIQIDFTDVDSPCMQWLNCFQGKCHTEIAISKSRCVCEAGWQGLFCNIKIPIVDQSATDLPKEMEEPSLFDVSKIKSSDGDENKLYKREDPVQISSTGQPLNSCNKHYKLRLLSDRQCFPNFVCQYGECRKKRIENFIQLECVCDLGAYGIICQHRCCLDCGKNGICAIRNGETEPFCKCREGFVGEKCNIRKIMTENNTRSESNLLKMFSHIQFNQSMRSEHQYLHTREIGATPNVQIIISCLLIAILLVLMLLLIPFVLWKKRLVAFMELVRYCQRYEDDSAHNWDVLICYTPYDAIQTFVSSILLPAMCKMSLKCTILHVTDTKSLEADSTWMRTMIKSRRIVIIPTKDFFQCTSSVRDFIQKYRYKCFCLHLPKSILTGIVEDTSNNTFHSGECLRYPHSENDLHIQRFWKVFEMLLPKKHKNPETIKKPV